MTATRWVLATKKGDLIRHYEFGKPCVGGNCQLCCLIGKKCVNEEAK